MMRPSSSFREEPAKFQEPDIDAPKINNINGNIIHLTVNNFVNANNTRFGYPPHQGLIPDENQQNFNPLSQEISSNDIISKYQEKKKQIYEGSFKEKDFMPQGKSENLSALLSKNNLYHTESAYAKALSKSLSNKKSQNLSGEQMQIQLKGNNFQNYMKVL